MVEMSQIEALSQQIAEQFHPERIILFGSYAYGEPTPDSDVDLLVVMPFEGHSPRQAAEIRFQVRPQFPLDLLVRTPELLRQRLEMGDFFMKEIVDEGKVLYEATDPGVD
ncbi:MAG: nucleotidyltransferase domain-containing protein [Leptolyngbyaceae cyanobacterium]